jgi:hypothetical protein
MIHHFLASATCLLFARLFYLVALHAEDPWRSVLGLSSLFLCLGGLGWGFIKLIDWWGEEAPIFDPNSRFKWSTMSYREAIARLKLVELFNGNARLARRQVRILMEKYPGKVEYWYWEKAILELDDSHS